LERFYPCEIICGEECLRAIALMFLHVDVKVNYEKVVALKLLAQQTTSSTVHTNEAIFEIRRLTGILLR